MNSARRACHPLPDRPLLASLRPICVACRLREGQAKLQEKIAELSREHKHVKALTNQVGWRCCCKCGVAAVACWRARHAWVPVSLRARRSARLPACPHAHL